MPVYCLCYSLQVFEVCLDFLRRMCWLVEFNVRLIVIWWSCLAWWLLFLSLLNKIWPNFAFLLKKRSSKLCEISNSLRTFRIAFVSFLIALWSLLYFIASGRGISRLISDFLFFFFFPPPPLFTLFCCTFVRRFLVSCYHLKRLWVCLYFFSVSTAVSFFVVIGFSF